MKALIAVPKKEVAAEVAETHRKRRKTKRASQRAG
jgi:hypothetical protein